MNPFLTLSLMLTLLVPATSVTAQNREQTAEILVSDPPATLVWQNREVFVFRATVDGFDPRERQQLALQRLNALEIGTLVPEVRVARLLSAMSVQVRGQPLFIFLEQDLTSDQTITQAAEAIKAQLDDAFAAYVLTHSREFILRAGTKAGAATLVFLVALVALMRLSRLILRKMPGPEHPRMRELKAVESFHIGPYAASAARGAIGLTFLTLELFAVYLWVTFVLGIFPYTKPWSDAAAGFLLDMLMDLLLGAIGGIPGLLTVVVIFWLTRVFVRILHTFFDAVRDQTVDVAWLQPETSDATRRLVVAITWIFAITVAYPYIPGSGSAAFKGVSVFVGLMVSLGSAGLINQVMSGLVVVYSKAFKPGELIRVHEVEGAVSEIGVLSTKVITKKLEEITIPNAVLVNTMTKNYSSVSAERGVVMTTSVTIGYDTPWRQVQAMLLLAAERTPGLRHSARSFVRQTALSDFYAEYALNVHLDDPHSKIETLSELHANIQDTFNEFGVQIMSPHFETQPDKPVVTPKGNWFDSPAKREPEGE